MELLYSGWKVNNVNIFFEIGSSNNSAQINMIWIRNHIIHVIEVEKKHKSMETNKF